MAQTKIGSSGTFTMEQQPGDPEMGLQTPRHFREVDHERVYSL